MTIMVLALLILPIWVLYHLTVTLNSNVANVDCIGILLVATLVFSTVLCMFTKARRHEVLAASAGSVDFRSIPRSLLAMWNAFELRIQRFNSITFNASNS